MAPDVKADLTLLSYMKDMGRSDLETASSYFDQEMYLDKLNNDILWTRVNSDTTIVKGRIYELIVSNPGKKFASGVIKMMKLCTR